MRTHLLALVPPLAAALALSSHGAPGHEPGRGVSLPDRHRGASVEMLGSRPPAELLAPAQRPELPGAAELDAAVERSLRADRARRHELSPAISGHFRASLPSGTTAPSGARRAPTSWV